MNKTWLYVIPVVLLVAGGVVYMNSGGGPVDQYANATPSVLVQTITLTPGTLPIQVSADGSVIAGPSGAMSLTTQASGMVSAVDVVPGQMVVAGQHLLRVAPDAQSIADFAKARNALTAARANQAHVAALVVTHLATNSDLATANQAVMDAQASLASLQASGSGVEHTIIAPMSGIVTSVAVAPGMAVTPGMALLQIAKQGGAVAQLGVPPSLMQGIEVGSPVHMQALITGDSLDGKVIQVPQMMNPQTGLMDVMVGLPADATMPIGAPLQAEITSATLSGYVVPRNAVQTDEQGDYVFQIDNKNIAHRVGVKVLGNRDDQTIIASNLDATMPMVTTGAYQLDDGVPVRLSNGGAGN